MKAPIWQHILGVHSTDKKVEQMVAILTAYKLTIEDVTKK